MTMAYIRRYYNVPAKRGGRVTWKGQPGRILSASCYLRVRLDAGERITLYPREPGLVYLDAESAAGRRE